MQETQEIKDFAQFLSDHQAHSQDTGYTDVVCMKKHKCSWCELYRNTQGVTCVYRYNKCTRCGILCYSRYPGDHEVVNQCMCSNESASQYNWYDGQVPGLCCNVCRHQVKPDPDVNNKSKDSEKDKERGEHRDEDMCEDNDKNKENSEPVRNIQKNPNHMLFIITEPDTRCL